MISPAFEIYPTMVTLVFHDKFMKIFHLRSLNYAKVMDFILISFTALLYFYGIPVSSGFSGFLLILKKRVCRWVGSRFIAGLTRFKQLQRMNEWITSLLYFCIKLSSFGEPFFSNFKKCLGWKDWTLSFSCCSSSATKLGTLSVLIHFCAQHGCREA